MFCPTCGDEYRKGFTECADCHVPLVPEPLPLEPKPAYVEYEYVLSTFNVVDIAIIRGVLDSEGIIYSLDGECFNIIRPMVQPAKLLVKKDLVEQAKEVLKDITLRYTALSFSNKKFEDDEPDDTPEDPGNACYDQRG